MPDTNSGLVEVTVPSTRSGSGVVKTSSVGMFGACTIPSTVGSRAHSQRLLGNTPDAQVGPRTLEPEPVEAAARRACSATASSVSMPLRPGRHRVAGSSSRMT